MKNMKTINTKKMRGFMCQSPAATSICRSCRDAQSVVVPRRPENTKLITSATTKYSRLVDSPRIGTCKRQVFVAPAIKKQDHHDYDHDANTLAKSTSPPPPPSDNSVFQVVVMRVSLHCQGCAGKLKKHLSKMEGVTSFNIELESKKVIVKGHVSPAGVLESISKVKRAEFWPCN